jgi:hypothetical protein
MERRARLGRGWVYPQCAARLGAVTTGVDWVYLYLAAC